MPLEVDERYLRYLTARLAAYRNVWWSRGHRTRVGKHHGEELTRRFWEGAVRGGYVGHGETYYNEKEVLWWSKGGELTGTSPERIAFLRRIIEQSPGGILNPLPSSWTSIYGG